MAKLINLSKIFCVIKKIGKNSKITKDVFFKIIQYHQHPDEGNCTMSLYQKHIQICKELNLLNETPTELEMTNYGEKYYELIPRDIRRKPLIDEKNDDLIAFVIERLSEIKDKEFESPVLETVIENGETKFQITAQEFSTINTGYRELFYDLKLIEDHGKQKRVAEQIVKYFPKKESAKLSEEELHKLLAKQIEIGSEAEEIAIKYEEKRLRELGKEELIAGITRVSKKNVREGYDIASFNGDVITTVYDRFIEVKATTGESPYFYWSENEIEVAKKKQDKYFVYLYTNLRNEIKRKLTVIQNPYHEIFEKDFSDKKEISTWRIMWHG